MRRKFLIVSLAAVVAMTALPAQAQSAPTTVDDIWIVVLAPDSPALQEAQSVLASVPGGQIQSIFEHVLNGFTFKGSSQAAQALALSPNVVSVEPNREYHAVSESSSNGFFRIDADLTWAAGDRGLTSDGSPVRIAILDTGIMTTHADIAQNLDLSQSTNCIDPGSAPEDDEGHGTHVAGIAAAVNQGSGIVGVASEAKIVVAKVLNSAGVGSNAQILCGLEHVAEIAKDGIPTVVNMSLGDTYVEPSGCSSSALHQAICNLTGAGVTVVAAAGNDGNNASNFYPAAYPETIAVSAYSALDTTQGSGGCQYLVDVGYQCDETLASFTNYGSVIDVTAPGTRVYSTTSDGSYGVKSGTSMASPFAAGVAALILSKDPTLTPAQVRSIMQSTGECPDGATAGASTCAGHGQWEMSNGVSKTIADPDGIPEPLINARAAVDAADPSGPDSTPPVVTVTSPADAGSYEAGIDVVTASYTCSDAGSGIASCVGDLADGATVDTSTPGTGYTFTVVGTDNATNTTTVTSTYDVVDTTAPVITLLGDDPLTHEAGTPFTDPGAQVTDNVDTTTTITGVSTVNVNTPGPYTVTYDYTDAASNPASQKVRTVNVVASSATTARVDFGGDGATDIAVFRPSNGRWYLHGQPGVGWGLGTDIAVPGDYDGDGSADFAVFRPSNGRWYVHGQPGVGWGLGTDIPVPGDYDGDGTTDFAVFRPSNGRWYVQGQSGVLIGASGDIPVPGDYDGNGTTDIAVFRPSNGRWYIQGQPSVGWGLSTDIPVPGDYNGDGTTDIAVFRPSNGRWYTFGQPGVGWGLSTDIPIPGDYNGDGTEEFAVFRPSNGRWYTFGQPGIGWGLGTDTPTPIPPATWINLP